MKFVSSYQSLTRSFLQAHVHDAIPDCNPDDARVVPFGWDFCVVDFGTHIVRFPKDEEALEALKFEEQVCSILPPMELETPQLRVVWGEYPFSIHPKIPGEHLLPEIYERLSESERADTANRLAEFFRGLHCISQRQAHRVGARRLSPYLDADRMRTWAPDVLPETWRTHFDDVMTHWKAVSVAPEDEVFGYFDAHGWNIAFDTGNKILRGIFDFSDCGIGDVHQEFHPLNVISPDLKVRVAQRYAEVTGRHIDLHRVDLYTYVAEYSDLFEAYFNPDRTKGMWHHLEMLHRWASTLRPLDKRSPR